MFFVARVRSATYNGLDIVVIDADESERQGTVVRVGETFAPTLDGIEPSVRDLISRRLGIDGNSSDVTVVPVKLMQVPEFKAAQDRDRYAPHVKPINDLVDDLRDQDGRGWLPWVAPMHGGVNARILAVFRDPGPKTVNSEYLAMQNADESAARLALTCAQTGIEASDLTAWNCYPWYINRAPKTSEMRAGFGSLKQVVALMPHLEVVIVHGVTAHHAWNLLATSDKQFVDQFGDRVLHTFHMSRGAEQNPDSAVRADRRKHRIDTYRAAAGLINGLAPIAPPPVRPAVEVLEPGAVVGGNQTVVVATATKGLAVVKDDQRGSYVVWNTTSGIPSVSYHATIHDALTQYESQ